MDQIIIEGSKNPLKGEIKISGAKNAALPIMISSLLCDGVLTLSNVPKLQDIATAKSLLESVGVKTLFNDHEVILDARDVDCFEAPYDIVKTMRASIWVLAPLLARHGHAKVSPPGGCTLEARQVDMHLSVLESMGASLKIENGYIIGECKKLQASNFEFNKVSVGATITGIMAAVLAEGTTNLLNCAIEPEIVDLCNCLVKMGAEIEGIGTSNCIIRGKKTLKDASYTVMFDRIEAGTYMVAAVITRGDLVISNIQHDIMRNVSVKLREAGAEIIELSQNSLKISSNSINPINIDTAPYPGFPTDMQAQMTALSTISTGVSSITETIFENRFMHVPELNRLGANITIKGDTAIVKGVPNLKGAEVMATDLRASVSLILAGLVAEGETILNRVYHLDRGYENLEQKLRSCGANIRRVKL